MLGQGSACESSLAMEGFRFATELTVRYSEVDLQGVANNAVYLTWLEIARIAYLARFPGGYMGLVEQGIDATNTDCTIRYLRPVRFDQRLRIHARISELRGARFRFEYILEQANGSGETVAEGTTGHACVDASTLRPVRIPDWFARCIAQAEALP